MLDGYVLGDGQSGASEHFMYYDGQRGDSEVVGCKVRASNMRPIKCHSETLQPVCDGDSESRRFETGRKA
jgi:hypothetical protein